MSAAALSSVLVKRWSDLPLRPYKLQRGQTDPTFGPAFNLTKGQVSDATKTGYGIMVFVATD